MRWWMMGLMIAGVIGCSGGDGLRTVKGKVTYDDTLIPEGNIMFTHSDKAVRPEMGQIKDGSYEIKVKDGKHKIEITASKMAPLPKGKVGAMGEKEMPAEYIPEKYNKKSDLSAEVGSSTPASLDFKVGSK